MARNKYPEETVKLILDIATKLFLQKGYDNTSLQDIINESKLSKGAIYHHFKSKEEIFESICDRIGQENIAILSKVRDSKNLSGYEKLKSIFRTAFLNPNQGLMLTLSPDLLDNPRFLAMQIRQIYELVVPKFIQPILQEGIKDGSIETEHPRELAEAIMTLSNVWLNPLVRQTDIDGMKRRIVIFNQLLSSVDIELLDEEMIAGYKEFLK